MENNTPLTPEGLLRKLIPILRMINRDTRFGDNGDLIESEIQKLSEDASITEPQGVINYHPGMSPTPQETLRTYNSCLRSLSFQMQLDDLYDRSTVIKAMDQQTAALQSQIEAQKSKIGELEIHKNNFFDKSCQLQRELKESKQLNEKLMGLLELMHLRYLHTYLNAQSYGITNKDVFIEQEWQSYCKEHGLTSPEKTEK